MSDRVFYDCEPVELWADYAAYDHVVLAQLWGPMVNLPVGMPMFTCDIQHERHRLGVAENALPAQLTGAHHALDDARHVARCWSYLKQVESQVAPGLDRWRKRLVDAAAASPEMFGDAR